SIIAVGSTVMVSFSSTVRRTPSAPSSSMVVVTSCRCGTLPIEMVRSASSVAHRIGSTAFLAPEICTSPSSGSWLPVMMILAMLAGILYLGGGAGFARGKRAQRERVDLAAHPLAERGVDQAMAGQRQLAAEGLGHDHGLEMHAVLALHLRAGAGQAGLDQLLDLERVHRRDLKNGQYGRMQDVQWAAI